MGIFAVKPDGIKVTSSTFSLFHSPHQLIMDSFVNLAKQGYQAYSDSHSDVSKTGGHEYNSPHHADGGGATGAPDLDHDDVVRTAEKHSGSGDSSLFTTALSFLSDNKSKHSEDVDEEDATRAHKVAYDEGSGGNLSASSMGSAAALQALKKFTSGGSNSGSGSSSSQTELISLAMAEAAKLFDKSGGASTGNKQDAVNGAAMTVMKLFVKSKMGGGSSSAVGGSDSGGLGQLMKLAQNFAK